MAKNSPTYKEWLVSLPYQKQPVRISFSRPVTKATVLNHVRKHMLRGDHNLARNTTLKPLS